MTCRVIVAAIIEKDENYLFGHKAKDIGPYPNTLRLIGGGVKLGEESITEALKREVREEANIEITDIERVSFDEDYAEKNGETIHYIFLVFRAKYLSGQAKPGDDIEKLEWVPKDSLKEVSKTVPIAKPSIKLFKELGLI
tara:strand:- start:56 stop:475 length:420 start_codon:yes stop_codon:yes gene_type:complete